VVHIDDLSFLGNAQVALSILSSCVIRLPFYFTQTIPPSSFLSLSVSFDKRVMYVCEDIMGPRSCESF
jgi:hypothetical protein